MAEVQDILYTAAPTLHSRYLLAKWDNLEVKSGPLEVYVIDPGFACSCPSPKSPCKHQEILRELLHQAVIPHNLPFYYSDGVDTHLVGDM